jgi:ADP-ribosylglycohydrolase
MTTATVTKPFGNCYWVEPGRLLAGEYPTPEQLEALVAARFHTFIDLTRPGEMPAYENYLRVYERVKYLRFAIVDHGIPHEPSVVSGALDAIDEALAAGGNVYVHCRAGIGRTGTVIGCYLIRRGHAADVALERLNALWRGCERSLRWPQVPETAEQIAYVLKWQEPQTARTLAMRATTTSGVDRYQGAMLGLALGDALGSLLPTAERERIERIEQLTAGGPLELPQGAWTADTAMTLCVAQSLLACGDVDLDDQLARYLQWQRNGDPSSTGVALAVPPELERSLATWAWSRKPLGSSHDPNKRDPHTLARTLPVAMYFLDKPTSVIDQAAEVSRTTLQSPLVLDACRVFGAVLLDALQGRSKSDILNFEVTPAARALRLRLLKRETHRLLQGHWRRLTRKPGEGDALALLSATLRIFERTEDFVSGLVLAVNESSVPAHAGAVFGALAGAHYGLAAIPPDWRGIVVAEEKLLETAEELLRARRRGVG